MRRRKRRNRTGIYLVMLVAALFVGTLAVHGYSLRANCQKLATEQQNLKDKKKSLKKEQEQIKEQKEYRKTDQYVEDVARENLGWYMIMKLCLRQNKNEDHCLGSGLFLSKIS